MTKGWCRLGMAVLVVGAMSSCTRGTEVELVNRSRVHLEAVSVAFTGGATPPQTLQPGRKTTVRFDPTSESHLVVRYVRRGERRLCRVDTYLEPGYRAHFRVEIGDTPCRVVEADVHITWL